MLQGLGGQGPLVRVSVGPATGGWPWPDAPRWVWRGCWDGGLGTRHSGQKENRRQEPLPATTEVGFEPLLIFPFPVFNLGE